MPSLHAKCPYIYSDDCLRLSQDLHLTKDTLTDKPLGVRHALEPAGRQLVALLAGGTRHNTLERRASKDGIPLVAVQELLGFLNTIGGLIITRRIPTASRILRRLYGRIFFGIRGAPLAHRYSYTPTHLLYGLTGATWPLGIAIGATSALFAIAGLASWQSSAIYAAYGYILFCATVFVHETMHVRLITRIHPITQIVIIQRGIRLSIVHPPLPIRYERLSALAGPCGGIAAAAGAAWSMAVMKHDMAAVIGALIAVFHALSLLPWTGDGRYLFQTKAVQQGI